jgi:hypothetical protein
MQGQAVRIHAVDKTSLGEKPGAQVYGLCFINGSTKDFAVPHILTSYDEDKVGSLNSLQRAPAAPGLQVPPCRRGQAGVMGPAWWVAFRYRGDLPISEAGHPGGRCTARGDAPFFQTTAMPA